MLKKRSIGPAVLAAMLVGTLGLTACSGGDPCADLQKLSDEVKDPSGMTKDELNGLLDKMADLGNQCMDQQLGSAKLPD